jgi:hypothetical protein
LPPYSGPRGSHTRPFSGNLVVNDSRFCSLLLFFTFNGLCRVPALGLGTALAADPLCCANNFRLACRFAQQADVTRCFIKFIMQNRRIRSKPSGTRRADCSHNPATAQPARDGRMVWPHCSGRSS